MKIKYDEDTDAIFFILSDHKVIESEEVLSGVIVDYDVNDQMTSVEILNFRSRKDDIELPIDMKLAS